MFPRALRRNMSVWRHSKSTKQCLTFLAPRTRKFETWTQFFTMCQFEKSRARVAKLSEISEICLQLVEVWLRSPKVTDHNRRSLKVPESIWVLPCFYRDKHKLHWKWNHNKPSQHRRLGLRLGRSRNNLTLIMKYFNKIGHLINSSVNSKHTSPGVCLKHWETNIVF